jgi:hypothetical protein
MTRHKILRSLLVMSFGLLMTMAGAQTTSVQNDNPYAAPESRSIEAPAAGDANRMKVESSTNAPMNVLEDVPRDTHGKRVRRMCGIDPGTDQMPAACRRLLEISSTPQSASYTG